MSIRRVPVLVPTVLALFLLLETPAIAEVTGNCRAQINGRDLARLSSTRTSDAIEVPWDGTLSAGATAPNGITGYEIRLEYMGFDWKVADGPSTANAWNASRSVKPYTIFGSGLYKLKVVSVGPSDCTGAALIEITGRRGITTAAGVAAIAVMSIGMLGLLLSTVNAFRGPRLGAIYDAASVADGWRSIRNARDYTNYLESLSKSGESQVMLIMAPESESLKKLMKVARKGMRSITLLVVWVPLVLFAGVAGGVPHSPVATYPRIRPKFRFSLFGGIGGALLGLGSLVLLQQMAIVYPARWLAAAVLVGGFSLALVLVNAGQRSATRRLNKRVATAEASIRPDPRRPELYSRTDLPLLEETNADERKGNPDA